MYAYYKENKLIRIILFRIILYYSLFRYHDLLNFKEKLKNTHPHDKEGLFFFFLERAYLYRLNQHGSSIGYAVEFKDRPHFPHGITGIFIGSDSIIGENCTIMQHVTIGSSFLKGSKHVGSPTIGNNVFLGAGSMVIGKISVGDNCRIGANAVVARDIPANTIVIPEMRYITREEKLDNYYYFEQEGKKYRYEHDVPVLVG